ILPRPCTSVSRPCPSVSRPCPSVFFSDEPGPNFATLTHMDEIRPEKTPGPAPEVEKQAAAEAGEAPRWGKGAELAEDGRFLEGPHARSSELRRLARIGADFIRGFRGLHFV